MLDILIRNWHPGIGDPSAMGWVTVVAYFIAAIVLLRQWRLSAEIYQNHLKMHRRLLFLFAVTMIGLGINKQLDLQTWLTNVGGDISRAQGWWENRRVAQAVVLTLIVLCGGALMMVIVKADGVVKEHRMALLGFLVLIVFVVVRASSFFQMDRLINFRVFGFRMNWFLELGGIAIIAASAMQGVRKARALRRGGTD